MKNEISIQDIQDEIIGGFNFTRYFKKIEVIPPLHLSDGTPMKMIIKPVYYSFQAEGSNKYKRILYVITDDGYSYARYGDEIDKYRNKDDKVFGLLMDDETNELYTTINKADEFGKEIFIFINTLLELDRAINS